MIDHRLKSIKKLSMIRITSVDKIPTYYATFIIFFNKYENLSFKNLNLLKMIVFALP